MKKGVLFRMSSFCLSEILRPNGLGGQNRFGGLGSTSASIREKKILIGGRIYNVSYCSTLLCECMAIDSFCVRKNSDWRKAREYRELMMFNKYIL